MARLDSGNREQHQQKLVDAFMRECREPLQIAMVRQLAELQPARAG